VAGGLAASYVDKCGFTWDIGGHVQFSHYDYFDQVMLQLLGTDGWLHHQRESWVWMRGCFVPYPFQYNIHRLPPADLDKCLQGLLAVARQPHPAPGNFREWIMAAMGAGIAETFLLPYNVKVWAYPPEMMNAKWVGERVAVADLARVLHNLAYRKDDVSWGPNNTFQFPKHGGTGAIWKACAQRLPQDRIRLNSTAVAIDAGRRLVTTQDGVKLPYDHLVTTLPLPELAKLTAEPRLEASAKAGLLHSSSNIFGLGLRGKPKPDLETKCWIYFPESDCPFYRVTVFSNYSPYNVPDARCNWSLMAEVSESPYKPVNQDRLLEDVIQGALNTRLIERRDDIICTWRHRADYGYPTPSLHRDATLAELLPFFEEKGIHSRGRFGAWKYEVSNQDHSFMQGVELIERLLFGQPEITFADPNHANSKKHPFPFERWCATT